MNPKVKRKQIEDDAAAELAFLASLDDDRLDDWSNDEMARLAEDISLDDDDF